MSWFISAAGTRSAVLAKIRKADVGGQAQGEAVKALLIEQLSQPSAESDWDKTSQYGVKVEASGHSHPGFNGGFVVKVENFQIALDHPEPEHPSASK